jgi:hypothetical protein
VFWIGVAQDRNRWRALVNSVMNLRVLHKMLGNHGVALQLGGLSSSALLRRVSLTRLLTSIIVYDAMFCYCIEFE